MNVGKRKVICMNKRNFCVYILIAETDGCGNHFGVTVRNNIGSDNPTRYNFKVYVKLRE